MESNKTFKKVSIFKLSTNVREAAKIIETKLRKPSNDEILIKNLYSGVNATDINISAGRAYFNGKFPFDIGLEGMGIIEAIGADVKNDVRVGQIGLIFAVPPKAYAEYLYIKAEEFLPIPSDKPEYIALLDCGLTAAIGLSEAGRIAKGDTLLITAAAGGTGHIGVQWAKLKGCHVIGLCSTAEKVKLLKQLGCDRVVDYKTENIDQILSEEYPNGIDVVWETIGGPVFETLYKHLAIGGRLVIVGAITGYKDDVTTSCVMIPDINTKLLAKSQTLIGFRFRNYSHLFDKYLKELLELYDKNRLNIVLDFGDKSAVSAFNSIDSVVDAIEYLHSGKSIGKVVVKIQ